MRKRSNNKHATYFAKACGVARFAYNWGLAQWKRQYEAGEKPTQASLRRQLNAIKREQFPWMLEVTKNAPQMALIHLGNAFQRFFRGDAKSPTFKQKGVHDSFTLTNDQVAVSDKRIRIPHLGWGRMRETLRFSGTIMSATISRKADKWYVSITVDTEETPAMCENQAIVGVDLGVNRLATLSDGTFVTGAKPHKALLNRLRRLSRSLSRKQKGSKNRAKAQLKFAKLHAKIANIRHDALHKLTTCLVNQYGVIVVEDLNVKGMMANHRLARAVGDRGFHELRRQLAYKTAMRGGQLIIVDRWFASSKICSECGTKQKNMPLSIREWTCPECGTHHDRDVNAARNLMKWAVSSTVTACREDVRPAIAEAASTKQEFNVKATYA
ncbi:RNA-guided endonuclease InsQ/TnpB family protein [Sulfobacillus thermosulfidooxidans]|uniref:RNA-guided endonuclease InsQ/TnpB family protein n=1 Tax=Sulfobacillus thermosulfidooxidans TaxID=28034 RepID=UPI0006B51191|nr:RNA-guided endonuclease TnpB family protein [Sulfobacillus thermosulfidooxidans]